MKCREIAYYRVSTDRQGESGLGLEGQKVAVAAHIARTGCELVAEYTEVETGTKRGLDNRPQLKKALQHAKRSKATLVIAKIDRLARNVAFVSNLMESGAKFVACDIPEANNLTIHILAAVAENEAKMISDRTKAGLAALKARGTLLGGARPECRNLTQEARQRGAEAAGRKVAQLATEAYADLLDEIVAQRKSGASLKQIADALNAEGQTNRLGRPWNAVQVHRILERATA